MKITKRTYGQVSVLSLNGKIMGGSEVGDIHTAIKLPLEKGLKNIIIDLKAVDWMGSVGVGILICCLTTVRSAGGDLKLSGLSEKVVRIFEMTKLENVFDTYPDIKQAVSSF